MSPAARCGHEYSLTFPIAARHAAPAQDRVPLAGGRRRLRLQWPCRRRVLPRTRRRRAVVLRLCKRLSRGGALSAGPGFVPVVVRGRGGGGSEPGDACASIELRGGRVLRLPVSMPAARVAELVHALEGLAW